MTTIHNTKTILNLDERAMPKRIGIIALSTDHTVEPDFAHIFQSDEVGIYVNRIKFENPTTHENLKKTGPSLTEAASDLLPNSNLDVLAYACTSASIVLGNDVVTDYLQKAKPNTPIVTPSNAAFAAFKRLNVKKIAILAPYIPAVTQELANYFDTALNKQGQEIISAHALGFEDDRDMAHISKQSLIEACIEVMNHPQNKTAEALFVSCTALRVMRVIEEIEDKIKRPVISSNQAMIWRSRQLLGMNTPLSGYGTLLKHQSA